MTLRPKVRFRLSSLLALIVAASILLLESPLRAQMPQMPNDPQPAGTAAQAPGAEMSMGERIQTHVLFDQLEGRSSSAGSEFRWDGEGWLGGDLNRLWIKTEGFAGNGAVRDGIHEFLYDRPIPRLRYFDLQAGVRADLDSGPQRAWAAIGIEGLAPYSFELSPTFYIRNGGNVAGRIESFYSVRLTQRLVAQPQIELNLYNKDDRNRNIGSGLSEIDTGLRLRYELSRKFAPYIGYAYNGEFGNTATYATQAGETAHNSSFVFGIRMWY